MHLDKMLGGGHMLPLESCRHSQKQGGDLAPYQGHIAYSMAGVEVNLEPSSRSNV